MRAKKMSKVFVWGILGLAVAGLGGFGVTNLGGSIRSIGSVGDQDISVDDYARALNQQMRQIGQTTGMSVNFELAKAFGVDQAVISDLVNRASLDLASAELGISISDDALAQALADIDAFKNAAGEFDPETYRFQLDNAGLTARDFEESLRGDESRLLLLQILQHTRAPVEDMARMLVSYDKHARTVRFKRFTQSDLTQAIPAPSDAEIAAYYAENTQNYMSPEQKKLTVFWAKADDFADPDAVDAETVQRLYDARSDEFNIPEQRFVERLAFLSADAATKALADIQSGARDFETIAKERGLTSEDIDLGAVSRDDLGASFADAVFAAEPDTVVGPFDTDFGPALFNVTAVSDAQNIPLEDVREELVADIARDRAARTLQTKQREWDDALAAGATLEELDQNLVQSVIYSTEYDGTLAGYPEFQEVAQLITQDDFPEFKTLSDDSLIAVRLDEVIAPTPRPLEDVKDAIIATLTAQAEAKAMADHGASLIETLAQDEAAVAPIRERKFVFAESYAAFPDVFISEVFQSDTGVWKTVTQGGEGYIFEVASIAAADLENTDNAQLVEDYTTRLSATYERDIVSAFARAVQEDSGLTLNAAAIEAVNAQMQ